jgi:fungal STAND N-terminal Goodbye domain
MSDSSGCRLEVLFDAALESYEKQTGMKLINHTLARQLENCHSVDSIMDLLQQQARTFAEFRGDHGKVKKSLKRTVHVLHALSTSTALGEGVGLVRHMTFLRIPGSSPSFHSHSHLQRQYLPPSPSYSPYGFPSS